jgi:hypothetical protein
VQLLLAPPTFHDSLGITLTQCGPIQAGLASLAEFPLEEPLERDLTRKIWHRQSVEPRLYRSAEQTARRKLVPTAYWRRHMPLRAHSA